MAQTIETTNDSPSLVSHFYDALASSYDAMTSFPKRFVQERPFFHLLVERFRIRTAVDAGCATGFHSILLAQLGVHVTAVDVSPKMLKEVERHAADLHVSIKRVESTFQKLRLHLKSEFDALFSMGNSLAHVLDRDELNLSLKNFFAVLKPGGVLFLQNLNYHRIMMKRERVQSVKESGETTFVRFYDYKEDAARQTAVGLVLFNILTINRTNNGAQQTLNTIRLRPVLRDELVQLLEEAGFVSVNVYGGISLEDFQPEVSKDLVVLARKPE